MTTDKENEMFYRAMVSRDHRFDGRFFVGVKTTGVYCRPICPAPKPKFQNVQFYPSAAGAECAGFRPCKRCRPDASPGTPVWSGVSDTVSQALQMIDEGFLDENSVRDLGRELGITDRQLRRLFNDHLGASPHAVALTRRLDFARKLIDETTLSMTDVAFASGFESIRRFNDAVKNRFGENPSILREAARQSPGSFDSKNRLVLQLPFRPPLDWPWLLSYLDGRQISGVEAIGENRYCRSIRIGTNTGFLTVTPSRKKTHLELTIQIDNTVGLMAVVQRVRRIFDLGADPLIIHRHLQKDPALAPVIQAFPGIRVPGGWDGFETAVRTIIGQQVSIKGANTIMGRLVERCGTKLDAQLIPGITHIFPTPQEIVNADLSGIGMPGKRAATIVVLAKKVASGEIVFDGPVHPETVKRQLMELPGIGAWTAEYIGMRVLREPDAFPGSDLALKRRVAELGSDPENWRPWRSYAAVYLWKSYSPAEKAI